MIITISPPSLVANAIIPFRNQSMDNIGNIVFEKQTQEHQFHKAEASQQSPGTSQSFDGIFQKSSLMPANYPLVPANHSLVLFRSSLMPANYPLAPANHSTVLFRSSLEPV